MWKIIWDDWFRKGTLLKFEIMCVRLSDVTQASPALSDIVMKVDLSAGTSTILTLIPVTVPSLNGMLFSPSPRALEWPITESWESADCLVASLDQNRDLRVIIWGFSFLNIQESAKMVKVLHRGNAHLPFKSTLQLPPGCRWTSANPGRRLGGPGVPPLTGSAL